MSVGRGITALARITGIPRITQSGIAAAIGATTSRATIHQLFR